MRVTGGAIALALALAGCSKSAPEQAADEPAPVALVRTAVAELGLTNDALTLYGIAEAGPGGERAVGVARDAVLVAVLAPTGTAVRAGAAIATIRPSTAGIADAARAASDAQVAGAALARARRLLADGLGSNAEVEAARGALTTARATQALFGGGGATLRAPASGTVQALVARPGDLLTAGTTVATVAVAGERRARFGIDPALAPRVHAGQVIRISAIDGQDAITATIVGVDPQVDSASRLASIFARVPSTIGVGQALRATLAVGATTTGITVPYTALLDDGGKSYVFIVQEGVAKRREVTPGNSAGDRIAILTGIGPNERVVTEGGTALEDGMRVRVQGNHAR